MSATSWGDEFSNDEVILGKVTILEERSDWDDDERSGGKVLVIQERLAQNQQEFLDEQTKTIKAKVMGKMVNTWGTIWKMGLDRKAHLLEDKQIPSVGVFDEVYFTFGRNLEELHVTRAHLEKKRTRLRTYTNISQDNVLRS
ncbi:hypothetical protein Tco_0044595 [Tanacetum coccineum]